MIEILLIWLPLCFVVAYVASQRGRSGAGFFFLSFFLSPLVGFLVLIALPTRTTSEASSSGYVICHQCGRARKDGWNCPHCGASNVPPPATKACPYCAEKIQAAAIKCRHCGSDLSPAAAGETVSTMGTCPGCRKLRGTATAKCVYCGSTAPVAA